MLFLAARACEVFDTGESALETTVWKTKKVMPWQHRKLDGRKRRINRAGLVGSLSMETIGARCCTGG